jgi:diaminopimelate epimerase
MKLKFTKMHGAGNDFVVLDATRAPLQLTRRSCATWATAASAWAPTRSWWSSQPHAGRRLPLPHLQQHRRRGRALRQRRALLRALRARPGPDHQAPRARRHRQQPAGAAPAARRPRHGGHEPPVFDHAGACRSTPAACSRAREGGFELWPLDLADGRRCEVAVLSMGNPHAVQRVDDVDTAPVAELTARCIERTALSRARSTPASCRCWTRATCAARLRARRRRDPGLRHRRLRRRGGRHPPGLAGPAGGRRTPAAAAC